MRVALYCRISTDEDLQRYSLANQETALRQHAERRGWEVAGVFVDRMSGSQANRPGLNKLLDSLADGEAEAVLVTEQDRLSRLDEIPWAILKQTFREAQTKLFTLTGEVDFGNEDHEFSADIMALIDRRRRKTIVRQMVRGRVGAAERGEWLGRPPFGCRRNPETKHLEPHPIEAPLVREIFQLYAQGRMGSHRIAHLMRDRISNKFVDNEFIVYVLRNPVYAGDIVMNVGGQEVRVEGAHEAIVSRDLWNACNRLLDERAAVGNKARLEQTVGLVAGMILCGGCGKSLSSTTAVKRVAGRTHCYHYYRHIKKQRSGTLPDGTPCRAAHRTDEVDAEVREKLSKIAASPAARRRLIRQVGDGKAVRQLESTHRELTGQLASLERKRERLLQIFLTGDWDRSQLNAEKRRLDQSASALEKEIAEVQARLRLSRSSALSIDLIAETFAVAADLGSLPFRDQQTTVRGLVERVVVNPDGQVTVAARIPVAEPVSGTTEAKFANRRVRAG